MTKNTGKLAAIRARTVFQAFEEKLVRGTENDCWEWGGTIMPIGYGQLSHLRKHYYAHRVSYEYHKGPIPNGLHVLHSCDNKRCVNPAHLSADTHAQNIREASERGLLKGNQVTKGTLHPLAKLDDEKVRHIRNSAERGIDLARRYGVAKTLISRVRAGGCWPHVV